MSKNENLIDYEAMFNNIKNINDMNDNIAEIIKEELISIYGVYEEDEMPSFEPKRKTK